MQHIRRLACCLMLLGSTLLGQAYAGEEKAYWNYDRAAQGILKYEVKSKVPRYPMPRLDLACLKGGDLYVEAYGLILWTDVSGYFVDTNDLDRLAIETSLLRIETKMVPLSSGYSGWASGTFKDGVKLAAGIIGTDFLIVRAVNRKPVSERPLEYSDKTLKVEHPDWVKAQPFLKYCSMIQQPIPRF